MTYIAAENRYESIPYRRVGRSGLVLPALSLGLWHNFGDSTPIDTQRALLRTAFDLGINHFDLANNYGPPYGSAEINFGRLLREDFKQYRDELIISSKAGWDMTARLLATRSLTEASGPSWTTILRSCGAYEAYLRTYRGVPSARNAAEFLLLDRLFPRSILFSVSRAEECMRALEPRLDRVGVSDNAQRLFGQIRSELEYRPIVDILENLPAHMDSVQDATSAASEAIKLRYFPTSAAPSWTGERR